jgi:hypothetical protein
MPCHAMVDDIIYAWTSITKGHDSTQLQVLPNSKLSEKGFWSPIVVTLQLDLDITRTYLWAEFSTLAMGVH